MKSGVGPSVKKVKDYPLYFVEGLNMESSNLDCAVVLAASLEISCLCKYFMIGVNSLFIEFVNMT